MVGAITTDHFLDHGLAVRQLKGSGHRSGMDAVMLAATAPSGLAGQVADLGAGAGVVGMSISHRCVGCEVDLIEIDPELVDLSRQSLQLEQNQHFADRVRCLCADITKPAEPLASAGRKPGSYAAIFANPPYNDGSHQTSPDKRRALAHKASDADIWVKTAAGLAAHRALLALIIRPANLLDYVGSIQKSFGNVIIKPLNAHQQGQATRLLIGSIRGSRAALQLLSPLVLHGTDGSFTDEAEDILRGRRSIDLFA